MTGLVSDRPDFMPGTAASGQPGNLGGAAVIASVLIALLMGASTFARCAFRAARSRLSAACAWLLACGVVALSTAATSSCTRWASGAAQVTRPVTEVARPKLCRD